jgi:hypothetical protein
LKKLLFILISLTGLTARAQEPADSLEDDVGKVYVPISNEKLKLGIKFGVGAAILVGTEADRPLPVMCFQGGLYLRYRFSTHWAIQPECNVSFRGGNFDNKDGEYGTIRTYFVDNPVLLTWGWDENNSKNVVGGLQYSWLVNSAIYKVNSNGLPEPEAPRVRNGDLAIVGGTQFHTPFIGFQIFLKYGLLNVNQGLLATLNPQDRGGTMHHLSCEINLIF